MTSLLFTPYIHAKIADYLREGLLRRIEGIVAVLEHLRHLDQALPTVNVRALAGILAQIYGVVHGATLSQNKL